MDSIWRKFAPVAVDSHRDRDILEFDAFQIDLRSGELHRNGLAVKLGPRETRVLLALVENPGELVTRSELRQYLWSSNTFVDFDNGLNNAISRLRSALGDTPDDPYFVQTVPRRGYRFVAPVKRHGAEKLTFRFRKIFFALAERLRLSTTISATIGESQSGATDSPRFWAKLG